MESLIHVDWDVVDAVLHGALLKLGLLSLHLLPIGGGDFGGVELDGVTGLEVDEAVRPCIVGELQLAGAVEGMEKNHFVAVVSQVTQGVEEFFLIARVEGVGEDDGQRAAVHLLGGQVQGLGDGSLPQGSLFGFDWLNEAVEEREQVALMGGVGAAGGLAVDAVGDEREAEGVALAVEQLYEYGSGIYTEGELVGMLYITLSFKREEHGGTLVDDYLAAEVCLFLELFDV